VTIILGGDSLLHKKTNKLKSIEGRRDAATRREGATKCLEPTQAHNREGEAGPIS